ncbi:MAG: hypothetical protein JNJ95_10140 [Dechloromonas sp.]|nr:hypothetical protein [Dechloromonas sp.]
MSPVDGDAVERIHRDHARMLEMIDRIRAECGQRNTIQHCNDCHAPHRAVCQGNIDQLIRGFIEATMKHSLIESMFMDDKVPAAHRAAHNQAHMVIAQQLKSIRVVLSEDGNYVHAIDGIDEIHAALISHFRDFDLPLERYLQETDLAPQSGWIAGTRCISENASTPGHTGSEPCSPR